MVEAGCHAARLHLLLEGNHVREIEVALDSALVRHEHTTALPRRQKTALCELPHGAPNCNVADAELEREIIHTRDARPGRIDLRQNPSANFVLDAAVQEFG